MSKGGITLKKNYTEMWFVMFCVWLVFVFVTSKHTNVQPTLINRERERERERDLLEGVILLGAHIPSLDL